jgi:hypothetical protein
VRVVGVELHGHGEVAAVECTHGGQPLLPLAAIRCSVSRGSPCQQRIHGCVQAGGG